MLISPTGQTDPIIDDQRILGVFGKCRLKSPVCVGEPRLELLVEETQNLRFLFGRNVEVVLNRGKGSHLEFTYEPLHSSFVHKIKTRIPEKEFRIVS